jgi:hypothetical protein
MDRVKPGNIIKGFSWPEPIEVKFSEKDEDDIRIVGVTIFSKTPVDQLIPSEDLSKLEIQGAGSPFSEEAWKVFLSLETIRYRFASLYDPLLAVNTSKIDPLPHQIEAVYGYVLKLPRIRFLIADDPGAGKTIMAGLIIKELKLRNLAKRILIVTPGHLKDQWRRELKERFKESFRVIDRFYLESFYGENIWSRESQIITSIDFLKELRVTFDKELAFKNTDAEFISLDHPLFESLLLWIEHHFSQTLHNGAVFLDPDGKLDGYLLFYEGEIKDGTGHIAGKRLFSFYIKENQVLPISPSILWDLEEGQPAPQPSLEGDSLKKLAQTAVKRQLKHYQEELLKERTRQSEIKEKYGIKSLNYLIVSLDGDLIELYDRKEKGESVDLAIRNKEERKLGYEHALKNLNDQIQREKLLSISTPHFVGILQIQPKKQTITMTSDKEVELAGMRVAIEYEKKQGRTPEDVAEQNLGFDIRSLDSEKNVRYIEVKARAFTGAVELTQNEWFKAKRFKSDYYLYAVFNATKNPELYIIQNPAETLEPEQKIEVVRYLIPLNELTQKGIKNVEIR